MEVNVAEVDPKQARKRSRNPKSWGRAKEKVKRYSAKGLPKLPQCTHNDRTEKFKCDRLTMADVKKIYDEFYQYTTKKDQDAFLLKHCRVNKTKRHRPRVGVRKASQLYTKLYVRKLNSPRLLYVCQKTFMGILRVTKHRVQKVAKDFLSTGSVVQERRDHVTAKNVEKLRAVKRFIETFKCIESHYCRAATAVGKYLPSTLNVRKMWKMYNAEYENNKVKECYFRKIFNTCYNLSFMTPRNDTYSRCSELTEKIKNTNDVAEKNRWIIEKRVYVLKYKAFYNILKEERPDLMTLSFDCQKNKILPKVSDQMAYYTRQLYIYNFGTVLSVETKTLTPENFTLFAWTEDEHRKGANEIVSAVYERLMNLDIKENIETIRLVADGCGAQNKNSIMIGMCATWLFKDAPVNVKKVKLVFPIPGHSFIPPDRVFGNIEKNLKQREVILTPDEYKDVFRHFGTVADMNNVMDWKSALQNVIRPPGNWHFQFARAKRFYIKRTSSNVLIRGEENYLTGGGVYHSILKKNMSFRNVICRPIEKNKVVIKKEKLKDVDKLLKKHYGVDWKNIEDLNYYKSVLERSQNNAGDDEYEEDICDLPSPESDLRVYTVKNIEQLINIIKTGLATRIRIKFLAQECNYFKQLIHHETLRFSGENDDLQIYALYPKSKHLNLNERMNLYSKSI